ncbi:MAG TPA: hypothetical protein V6D22_24600 [Candidatus Obscuribacterales bacterium]
MTAMIPRRNNQYGSTMLDFVVGTMLAISLTVVAVDLVLYMTGYGSNDSAARDAARAAGTADSAPVAKQAAVLACASHKTDGFTVSQPQVDMSAFHFADDPTAAVPLVSITTRCDITLPAANFFAAHLPSTAFAASRRYVFPALVLAQQPPILEPFNVRALITSGDVSLPLIDGSIPGVGSSDVVGSSE